MTEYVCHNCGDRVTGDSEWEAWECAICGGDVVPEDKSDVVPKDDLRELIEEWRTAGMSRGEYSGAKEDCPDDLGELIND